MPFTYLYILSDEGKALFIKTKLIAAGNEKSQVCFCGKQLVYYEIFDNLDEANNRKKTIESWPEEKIKFLIDFVNPSWEDWKKEISN